MRKAERTETSIKASGRDLVPVKASLVEEELAKLGLNLTYKSKRDRMVLARRLYKAGEGRGPALRSRDRVAAKLQSVMRQGLRVLTA